MKMHRCSFLECHCKLMLNWGGTEGVALGAVYSFALKNNVKGRAAVCDAFHLHATLAQTHPWRMIIGVVLSGSECIIKNIANQH